MDNIHDLKQALFEFFKGASSFSLIFMGNRLRRDDGVGVFIGEVLLQRFPALKKHAFIVHNTPANYLGAIIRQKPTHLLFVDGVDLQVKPGVVVLAPVTKIPPASCITTHYQDFRELLRFMEMELEQKPRSLLLGIQVGDIEYGEGLSPRVLEKANTLVDVLEEVCRDILQQKEVLPF